MKELQVPTRRFQVEVVLCEGTALCGDLYVSYVPHQDPTAADIVALLNDERPFVPLRQSDGVGTLLSKDHIARVTIAGASEDELHGDVPFENDVPSCELELSDGTRLEGRISVSAPLASSRLCDRLNHAARFTPFVSAEGIELINLTHVVRAT